MKLLPLLAVAAAGGVGYWLWKRSRVAGAPASAALPPGYAATQGGAMYRPDQYGGIFVGPRFSDGGGPGGGGSSGNASSGPSVGIDGLGGPFLDSLTGVLAGNTAVRTQNALNVDTSGMTVGAIAVAGAALVGAAYFIGGGLKGTPRRRRKARRRK